MQIPRGTIPTISPQLRKKPSVTTQLLSVLALKIRASPRPSAVAPLERDLPALIIPNPDRLIDLRDKDLPIPDRSGSSRRNDRVHRLIDHLISHDDLDLHLRQQVNLILSSTVDLGVALLPSMSPSLHDRHTVDADLDQRILHCIQLRRLNHRFNLLHNPYSPSS